MFSKSPGPSCTPVDGGGGGWSWSENLQDSTFLVTGSPKLVGQPPELKHVIKRLLHVCGRHICKAVNSTPSKKKPIHLCVDLKPMSCYLTMHGVLCNGRLEYLSRKH